MSTYLVAFIISDFTYINAQVNKGVLVVPPCQFINLNSVMGNCFIAMKLCLFGLSQVRIWARKKAIDDGQGNYALNITQPILEFFEKYYNTSYPLSKSGTTNFIKKTFNLQSTAECKVILLFS